MHLEGCREQYLCSVRYSRIGDVVTIYFPVRSSYLHRYPDNPEQTPYRAQRMIPVGPRCHTVYIGTVSGAGREGKRAYM